MKLARAALRDLEEIRAYLVREVGHEKADRTLDLMLDRLTILDGIAADAGTPRPELGPGIRSWPIGRYVAYYRVRQGEAEIARVRHAARDPETLTLE